MINLLINNQTTTKLPSIVYCELPPSIKAQDEYSL